MTNLDRPPIAFLLSACIALVFMAFTACSNRGQPVPEDFRHVHLMHLDGFRPDVFKELLDSGQLPHFEFLLKGVQLEGFQSAGKISYQASTVDKTETFKAIQSYLTSRRDTEVVHDFHLG